jgi:hypothetical protein
VVDVSPVVSLNAEVGIDRPVDAEAPVVLDVDWPAVDEQAVKATHASTPTNEATR